MDSLNKSMEQVQDLFRSMTPGARITSGLLLAVVVISLVFLFRFDSSSPDSYLLGGHVFSAGDLAAAQGAFGKARLSGFEVEGNRICVPRGQKDVYVAALVDGQAMPRYIGSWFKELENDSSPFESQKHRDVRLRLATQNELGQIIGKMKGIEEATVLFEKWDNRKGFRRETEVTASVGVKLLGDAELETERVKSIRLLVAGAIAGLQASNVTITDLNRGYTYPGGGDSGVATAENDAYATRKRYYEQEWEAKVKKALGYIPGVKITTNVQLENELDHRQRSVKFDPQVVATKTEFSLTNEKTTARAPGGRPGVIPNAVASNQQAAVTQERMTDSDKSQESEIQEAVASHNLEESSKAPLTPKMVTVSVVIPRSYYRRAWESQNRAPDGTLTGTPDQAALLAMEMSTKQEIQNTVLPLLPPRPAGDDKYPLVNVATFEDGTVPLPPSPGTAEKATSWLARNWTALGMMGVGLVGLLMLRSMLRSEPPRSPRPTADIGAALSLVRPDDDEPDQEAVTDGPSAAKRKRHFTAAGPNPRDELAEMVNESPEAAAAILRSWIGEAS